MLGLLVASMFIHNVGLGIYTARNLEPLPTFEFLYTAAFVCGVVWWLRAEIERSAVDPIYCDGLLVSLAWLILVPYYLFKIRGVHALIPLSIFVSAVIVSYIFAGIAAFLLSA